MLQTNWGRHEHAVVKSPVQWNVGHRPKPSMTQAAEPEAGMVAVEMVVVAVVGT